jgi:membrane-associated protease RseP (regulator of RpoE activity)
MLFQIPPSTRFDLNFAVAGIPVRVHPLLWLIAVLFGSATNNLLHILLWVAAIFISILIHEMGHALAFRRLGQPSYIILHVAGGLTVPQSIGWGGYNSNINFSPNQHIFISLAGPVTGFLFAVLTLAISKLLGGVISFSFLFGLIPLPSVLLPIGGSLLTSFVGMLLWVNIFWGIINLMPVYPLDGGHVARYALLQSDPWDGVRKSLWLSVITGGILALAGLLLFRSIYMAFLFGLLAFQSYQSLQNRF